MELPTRFEPKEHEGPIYAAWKASGGFQPKAARGGRLCHCHFSFRAGGTASAGGTAR